jgi:hypothetical protein
MLHPSFRQEGSMGERLKTIASVFWISSIFLLLFATPAGSDESSSSSANLSPIFSSTVYVDETIFVKIPAEIGDMTGTVVGGVAGVVIGIPLGVVFSPVTGGTSIYYFPILGGYGLGTAGGKAGAAIVGFPFYVLQKTFYDFPKWLFTSNPQEEM